MTQTQDIETDRDEAGGARDLLLAVSDLHAGYGHVPVLRGVSLELREGEALGIIGHNGMGKTTLLKAVMGLLPVTGGRIVIDGVDVTQWPAHERSRLGIGYVPQGRGILPGLTAQENLRLAWTPDSGETEESAIERVVGLLPRLSRLLDRRGGTLSGGEQQILALARALVGSPWLLILDEPSEGIQPSIVEEIGAILTRLRDSHRLSLLIVEQNLELVLDVATRVVLVERGRITRTLDPAAVRGGAVAELVGLGPARISDRNVPAAQRPAPPAPRPVPARRPASEPPSSSITTGSRPAPPALGGPMSTVKRPTLDQMSRIAASLHMSMSEQEVAEYLDVLEGTFQAYDRVNQLPDYLPPVRYPRTPGYRPGAAENPLNAWAVKSEVRGAAHGPLAGKRVVLKDNICLAGVPMMNGASTLEGYVPDVDATLVTRILDAGGTIVGKAHCEYFCLSGGSHTSALGPVHNPFKFGYSAGGSSSGCGGAGRRRRDRDGDRRRPGRLDPHAGLLVRLLRHEADPRPRALHRHHADRADHRSHRADDRDGRRQRAAARGDRRAGRARPAPVQCAGRQIHRPALGRGVAGLRIGVVTRRLRLAGERAGRRRQGARGGGAAARPRRERRGGLDPDAPRRPRRSGRRSRSKAWWRR